MIMIILKKKQKQITSRLCFKWRLETGGVK